MRRPGFPRLVAAAAAAMLVLAGCDTLGGHVSVGSDGGSGASDGGTTSASAAATPALPEVGTSAATLSVDPATDEAYSSYYSQNLDWQPCEEYRSAQCATLVVPRVWNDPSAGDISLAMLRIPATGEKKGSLLMNPGGPGGSGVSFVGESSASIVSEGVRSSYDLIGFDPRGVASSTGIRCLTDAETDEYLSADYDMTTPEGVKTGEEWTKRVAEACEKNSADMLGVIDTESAARDMDVMRAAVGSEKLDYLGFSYGTYLGATYAELYPQRTGRLVLDGAIDPTLTSDQMARGQAEGFEYAIHNFATSCLAAGSSTCPLTGTEDEAVQQIRDFFTATDAQPVRTGDPNRPLTGSLARSGVLVGLYNDANYPYVIQGLKNAKAGDGSLLLYLADLAAERNDDGTYTGNGNFSIIGVNCLDHPAIEDQAWMAKEAKDLAASYPTFGGQMGYSGLTCSMWPEGPVREPAPIHASGSAPIVVIGTTGDPATPYPWAQALAEQLDEGTLITWKGQGHTAYGRSGGCVEQAVDAFLLEGTVPEDGLTCG